MTPNNPVRTYEMAPRVLYMDNLSDSSSSPPSSPRISYSPERKCDGHRSYENSNKLIDLMLRCCEKCRYNLAQQWPAYAVFTDNRNDKVQEGDISKLSIQDIDYMVEVRGLRYVTYNKTEEQGPDYYAHLASVNFYQRVDQEMQNRFKEYNGLYFQEETMEYMCKEFEFEEKYELTIRTRNDFVKEGTGWRTPVTPLQIAKEKRCIHRRKISYGEEIIKVELPSMGKTVYLAL
ncbi:hypothetical protein B7494_g1039 [Chlorociboria aeruginascens]|nr:hypothetical protein B7494_g1039 [Chlorociboria aeruginascens]